MWYSLDKSPQLSAHSQACFLSVPKSSFCATAGTHMEVLARHTETCDEKWSCPFYASGLMKQNGIWYLLVTRIDHS